MSGDPLRIELEGESRGHIRRTWSTSLRRERAAPPDPMTSMRDAATGRGEVRYSNAREVLARASRLSIFDVLEDFFGIVAPRSGESWKGQCPFSFEHPDGGMSKGFRTYPATNSGYCFVMHGVMDPIRIMVIRTEERPTTAARLLLEHYGIPLEQHWKDRSRDLIVERSSRSTALGDPTWAAHALQTSLERYDEYSEVQFEERVAEAMDVALRELDELMRGTTTTDEDLRTWLRASTEAVMVAARTERTRA